MDTENQYEPRDDLQKQAELAIVAMRGGAVRAASAPDAYRAKPSAESADDFNAAAREWQAARPVMSRHKHLGDLHLSVFDAYLHSSCGVLMNIQARASRSNRHRTIKISSGSGP